VSKLNSFALPLFYCPFGQREQEGRVKISEVASKTLRCVGGSRRIVSANVIVDQELNIKCETHRHDIIKEFN
jgi:adenine specific DNA methylase Mod